MEENSSARVFLQLRKYFSLCPEEIIVYWKAAVGDVFMNSFPHNTTMIIYNVPPYLCTNFEHAWIKLVSLKKTCEPCSSVLRSEMCSSLHFPGLLKPPVAFESQTLAEMFIGLY